MRVEEGSRVKLSFICRFEDGTLYDFTDRDQLEFVVGQGNTLPTLEIGVLGMKEGEQRSIQVPTAELDEFPYVQDEAPTEPGFSAGTAGGGYEFGPGEEGDVIDQAAARLITPPREPPASGFVIFEVEVIEVSEAEEGIEL